MIMTTTRPSTKKKLPDHEDHDHDHEEEAHATTIDHEHEEEHMTTTTMMTTTDTITGRMRHTWISIRNAIVQMETIKDALVKDPEHKDIYEKNFAAQRTV